MVKSIAAVAAMILHATAARAGEWTTGSFEDFRPGSFLDGGSNLYVSAAGRMQMINRWDLDGDGHLDIVMPSGHCHTEKEDTFIYLNSGDDIDGASRILLPANGSRGGVIVDLNKDGLNDLAVCNGDNGITTWTDAYVYYGTKDGFTVDKRVTLPARACTSIAAGDFDGDGWVDLAIACQWQAGAINALTGPKMSFVYWNSAEGFNAERRTTFTYESSGATVVGAADFDGDGKTDLVQSDGRKTYVYLDRELSRAIELPFAASAIAAGDFNGDKLIDLAMCVGGDSMVVLMNGAGGLAASTPIRLPARDPRHLAAADFDGDGRDDLAVANYASPEGANWIDSYVYFSDGAGFTARPRVDLPTFGAAGVSAGDLNGDGRPELVFSNQRILNQQNIPSCVYWNVGETFRTSARTELETQGSVANAIGDVNADGRPDVVFFNFEGNFRDGASTSQVYFGDGTRHFPRRIDLHTFYVTSVAHADLNDDGFVDLVLTQSRLISGIREDLGNNVVIICWGGDDNFSRRTRLAVDYLAGGVRIADFNRDGWLDLIVGAISADRRDPAKKGIPVFFGSPRGYSQNNRAIVAPAAEFPRVPTPADVDSDGWLDLVGQSEFGKVNIWWGDGTGAFDLRPMTTFDTGRKDQLVFIDAADLNKDGYIDLVLPCRKIGGNSEVSSFVYYGGAGGFTNARREELPSSGIYEVSIADLDRDGWLDLVFTSYQGNFRRNFPSYIYFGSDRGFLARPRVELPTCSSSGVETADYDGDGFLDILFSNHRSDGFTDRPGPHNHLTDSMLYWGGRDGFSPAARWDFSANGPHAMNLRDVGNGIDRGLYEDYVSPPFELPPGQRVTAIRWTADTPHGTRVALQLRSAATRDALPAAAWHGPRSSDDWHESPGAADLQPAGGVIQYRARLQTPNGGPTPILKSVTIEYR